VLVAAEADSLRLLPELPVSVPQAMCSRMTAGNPKRRSRSADCRENETKLWPLPLEMAHEKGFKALVVSEGATALSMAAT